jgi:hypothetical protein
MSNGGGFLVCTSMRCTHASYHILFVLFERYTRLYNQLRKFWSFRVIQIDRRLFFPAFLAWSSPERACFADSLKYGYTHGDRSFTTFLG